MYFVLYDRNFNSIGETYLLESWSRIQRATDFDELRIKGDMTPYSADPFFVVVNDRQGKMKFSGLASTPVIDDKNHKTSISLKDYMTLMNSEILIPSGSFSDLSNVGQYLDVLLSLWSEQVYVGINNISWDVSSLAGIPWDNESLPIPEETENSLLYDRVRDAISYYNLYCTPILNIYKKELKFVFHRSSMNKLSLKLSDFGIPYVEKSFGEYNRSTIYSSDFHVFQSWALTTDNILIRSDLPSININIGGELSSDEDSVLLELFDSSRMLKEGDRIKWGGDIAEISYVGEEGDYEILCNKHSRFYENQQKKLNGVYGNSLLTLYQDLVYPAKNRNFVAKEDESIYSAVYDAVLGLAGNRYQENIDLDAEQYSSVLDIRNVDFSYSFHLYTEEGYYKELPVGEIETNSDGVHIIRLGYRIQELTQEI